MAMHFELRGPSALVRTEFRMPDASEPNGPTTPIANLLSDFSLQARRLQLGAPQVLFQPDTPAQSLYFLEDGQIRIYQVGPQDSARLANILGAGAWFGVAALSGDANYGARAEVASPSVVWEMDRQ